MKFLMAQIVRLPLDDVFGAANDAHAVPSPDTKELVGLATDAPSIA